MSWATEHFGELLETKDGSNGTATVLEGKKLVGIYFSAHWCPPCRGFTPVLAEFYEQVKETAGSDLEIVFVSSDSDNPSFLEYYSHMPWTALPFTDREKAQKLGQKYGVRGIPSLIILDGTTGEIKDKDGRSTVIGARGDVDKVLQKWKA